jgi:G:T-mismatch repair DNA endonuclease (very short patch repair protein)
MKVPVNCTSCGEELEREEWMTKKRANFFCDSTCKSRFHRSYKTTREKDPKDPLKDRIKFNENIHIITRCKNCNENYIKLKRKSNQQFCARKCFYEYKKNSSTIMVACEICHEKFDKKTYSKSGSNLCSKECKHRWQGKTFKNGESKECLICNEEFYVPKRRLKTAITCSKKCRYKWLSEVYPKTERGQELLKIKGITTIEKCKLKETKPEIAVREWLIANNIRFEFQKTMYDKFIVDFYLIDSDLVLEVYGDYWHGNSIVFGDNKKYLLSERQIKQINKDKSRKAYLKKCGHNFQIIWEYDIKKDIDKFMTNIIKAV